VLEEVEQLSLKLEEIEQLSLKLKKWLPHPKIKFIFIHGKNYLDKICDKEIPNKGAMRQHIESKIHKIDFYTGKALRKSKIIFQEPELESEEKPKPIPPKEIKEKTPEEKIEAMLREMSEQNDKEILLSIRRWKIIRQLESINFPREKINEYKKQWDLETQEKPEEQPVYEYDADLWLKSALVMRESDPYAKYLLAECLFKGTQYEDTKKTLAYDYLLNH